MTINKKATNLIETWINCANDHIPGYKVKDALADLNNELGKNYDMNRIGKWRRGVEAIPQPVQDFMLKDVIYYVLEIEGLVEWPINDQLDRIAEMLTPPKRIIKLC